ncbi:energy transducer TonB [Novosphingobium sp. JCM 18896]|uniref:energy transducer TonB n=1 Tax=Novosphingobium sp. JCM 18896 TaxID=2989731 RepID=UPI002222C9E7|nr:energy transducer TonB [Novosphingobium sp. JCM 18896]MCW1431550.1 TonB family protein [Novosphingobium sp. JCM 18896]
MAYTDHRAGGNQRAVATAVVALIQGAAIVALINGFTVKFFDRPPPPRTEAAQIPLTPIPVPPSPPDQTIEKPIIESRTQVPDVVLTPRQIPADPVPLQPLPDFIPAPHADPLPQPSPTQTFTPRAAKPRNAPGGWATTNDYPSRDLREGNQGTTRFTLAIDANGRVQNCTVIASSGHPGLDQATCEKVSRRAQFEPATDGEGKRVPSTYTSAIRWQIPRD